MEQNLYLLDWSSEPYSSASGILQPSSLTELITIIKLRIYLLRFKPSQQVFSNPETRGLFPRNLLKRDKSEKESVVLYLNVTWRVVIWKVYLNYRVTITGVSKIDETMVVLCFGLCRADRWMIFTQRQPLPDPGQHLEFLSDESSLKLYFLTYFEINRIESAQVFFII